MSLEAEVQNNTRGIASLNKATADLKARADRVEDRIPGDASQTNKLADKQWVLNHTGLQGSDADKTVREVASDEVAKIVADAPEAYDTLKEVANWIQDDTTGAAAMATAIAKNTAAVKELQELQERPGVEVVAPSLDGAGKAADAAAVYTATAAKRGMLDLSVYKRDGTLHGLSPECLPITGSAGYSDFGYGGTTPTDGYVYATNQYGEAEMYATLTFDEEGFCTDIDCNKELYFNGRPFQSGSWPRVKVVYIPTDDSLLRRSELSNAETNLELLIAINRGRIDEVDMALQTFLNQTFNVAISELDYYVQKCFYYPTDGSVLDDDEEGFKRVSLRPYTIASLPYYPQKISISVADDFVTNRYGQNAVRDLVFVLPISDTVFTLKWPSNFHPRTDAETDFACVAGVRNVYWITEYAPNEFCVAGWQETAGGSAS